MRIELLREFISLTLEGEWIKRSATPDEWRTNRDEAFETEIETLAGEPEFKTVEVFVNYKIDNNEYTFNAAELQALARNAESKKIGRVASQASPAMTSAIKQELTVEFGFKFEPRAPVKFVRGGMASSHGTHPFARSGGGGSGFGSDFGGTTFTSFGGGPGAMGGEYVWDKEDKKNLPMGAAKRAK